MKGRRKSFHGIPENIQWSTRIKAFKVIYNSIHVYLENVEIWTHDGLSVVSQLCVFSAIN